MVNLAILVGRTTKKPDDLRYTPSGTAALSFGLATDDGYGENKKTTFHDIVCYGKTAEAVAEHVEKGQQLYVEGRIQKREYEAQDGSKRRVVEIVANRVQFLSKPSGNGQRSSQRGDGEQPPDSAPQEEANPFA